MHTIHTIYIHYSLVVVVVVREMSAVATRLQFLFPPTIGSIGVDVDVDVDLLFVVLSLVVLDVGFEPFVLVSVPFPFPCSRRYDTVVVLLFFVFIRAGS